MKIFDLNNQTSTTSSTSKPILKEDRRSECSGVEKKNSKKLAAYRKLFIGKMIGRARQTDLISKASDETTSSREESEEEPRHVYIDYFQFQGFE